MHQKTPVPSTLSRPPFRSSLRSPNPSLLSPLSSLPSSISYLLSPISYLLSPISYPLSSPTLLSLWYSDANRVRGG
ncbi:MAG: hypothetical protein D6716_12325 [Chloroflexi bacterium]|nr:MAG: hypothetical protein D6716_12325 [Chloroflexota bacterium]